MKGKAIVIKGDSTKCYDEVIFVMKKEKPNLILADKIINKYKREKMYVITNILECGFYLIMLVLAIVIGIKIVMMI